MHTAISVITSCSDCRWTLRLCAVVLTLLLPPAALSAQSVVGRVTDPSGAPLVAVQLTVDGTSLGAQTRDDGTYRISGVPTGQRTIVARRIGYIAARHTVTVATGDVTADFQLSPAPMSLEGVVTTATGVQRRVELGNTIASIDAGARTVSAPIRSMGELLTAQATGVQVLPSTVTGASSRVRIRGQASRQLDNDPIYVVDGVRINTGNGGIEGAGSPSRLNDINPEEIENIEIVKGPSAATLYGTDAANGVILITTKRGRAGATRWGVHGERGLIRDENDYPSNYQLVGRSNPNAALRKCRTYQIADGSCLFEQAFEHDILEDPDVTFLGTGERTVAGGSVSGGVNDNVTYYISGDRQVEYGPFKLPEFDRRRFVETGQVIRDYVERPSQFKLSSARVNVNMAVNPKVDIALNTGFSASETRLPRSEQGGTNLNGMWQAAALGDGYREGPGIQNPFHPAGYDLGGYLWETPGVIQLRDAKQTVNRFIGGTTANWRPIPWLTGSGDVGIDFISRRDKTLERKGEAAYGDGLIGPLSQVVRTENVTITANARGTASWQLREWANLKSTLGLQFVGANAGAVSVSNVGLGPGGEDPEQGTVGTAQVNSTNNLSRTIGVFLEEQIALRDRLFLTLAARSDQNSAFGSDIKGVVYPKASLSWLATEESFFPKIPLLDQLRLRAALGSSGVQPGQTDALRLFSSSGGFYRDTVVSVLNPSSPGNPELKPERSTEFETGFESRWWDERINLEFTYYKKRTSDALVSQPVAPSAGVSSYLANLGGMENSGIEYRLNAQLLDTRNLGFDITFSGSNNKNKITDLGGIDAAPTSPNQEGRPVNSVFVRPIRWNTSPTGNMGLLRTSDVTILPLDSAIYLGPQLSPIEMTLQAGAELLGRRLRVTALFDRKAGGFQVIEEQLRCSQSAGTCPYTTRLEATLEEQAIGIAQLVNNVSDGFWDETDFIRWREVAVTYDLGERVAQRYLRARGARINAGIRNIKLWSDWRGVDPEGVRPNNSNTTSGSTTPGLPTVYSVRLSLTF